MLNIIKRTIQFVFICFALTVSVDHVQAAWYDDDWSYRKSHTITGSSDGSLTNYQIKIIAEYGSGSDSGDTVYLVSNSEADFSDVRFVASDEVTLLDYWIESKVEKVHQ